MKRIVGQILSGERLTEEQAAELVDYLTSAELDPALAAAALAGLRTRGETADELRAFAKGLQRIATRPDIDDVTQTVDVVGTGGDASGSLNLSTGSALLAAAAGAQVIKHGNRSVSSRSGSFDALSALGLDVPWDPSQAGAVFDATGFTYLFAPMFHPSMKAVAPVRQSMGARTIFNLVGPLANPARTPYLVVGAFSPAAAEMMAQTLSGMAIERAYVVHGEPGWDEPTPMGPYLMFDVTPGRVERRFEDPSDFGVARCNPSELVGADPGHNAQAIRDVFAGQRGPHRDALILGATLALRVTGSDHGDAIGRVRSALDEGRAADLLQRLSLLADQVSVHV